VEEDAPIFRALGDPNRRLLLDRLFVTDGQTLGELAGHLPGMTRQGAMKHLRVLEDAGLIVARREGREKRHFLNPVPIRRIHDRWISKYTAPWAAALADLKDQLEDRRVTTKSVYEVYIKAPAERVWEGITNPELTAQYHYGTAAHSAWTPGARLEYLYPDGRLAAEGEILEADPPRKVQMTFHAVWDDEVAKDPPVRMTWEITPSGELSRLTVTTDDIIPGSATARDFAGGVVYIVSGLKSLLETGAALPAAVG
jgi:uncharacterized protein YndB with AHSA1/START domain/DNA-binding transcriptional ArsR family regulator